MAETKQTKLEIKPLSSNDAVPFLRLEARCFGMMFNRNSLYFWRPVIEYGWAFKAVQRRSIVGGIIAMPTRQEFIYINSLFVHPRFRDKGIGTRLLETVLSLRARKGFILDMKVDKPHVRKLYTRHGFKVHRIEPNYYLDNSDRIIMIRKARNRFE